MPTDSASLPPLTIEALCSEARVFSREESTFPEPSLFGVTDGKAVGTYLEHKFRAYLSSRYQFATGNSASGIDFPALDVDMKVTSILQPQSSCPFKSARQKVFGLGYHLLVFVYTKTDDPVSRAATLRLDHTIFVEKQVTADFQMTRGLSEIIANQGNEDDLIAFMTDKMLPVDSIAMQNIAADLLTGTPLTQGYLTISNALQWRLQYARVITLAGTVNGVVRIT